MSASPPIAAQNRTSPNFREGPIVLKNPKLLCDNFPAKRRNKPRPSIDMASNSLAKLPVSSSPCDEVPHMFTRKPRLQPGKFLISSAKRLLQHNRPIADVSRCSKNPLLDHLVGAAEQRDREGEAMRLRGLDQLELGRLHDRQVGRLYSLEDTD